MYVKIMLLQFEYSIIIIKEREIYERSRISKVITKGIVQYEIGGQDKKIS